MKIGIMQPYFFPYIGYWQLINAVDIFVVYDNIKYTKKGWINRNRFLQNGKDTLFSLAIKNDSDYKNINERFVSDAFDRKKLLSRLRSAYAEAPYFSLVMPLIENIVYGTEQNLFEYIYNSIIDICLFLKIDTKIVISSSINIEHSLCSSEKVKAICKALGGKQYINPIGGLELYDKQDFFNDKLELKFIKSRDIFYRQFDNDFVPSLSIVDVMMFNSASQISSKLLLEYDMI